MYTTNLIYAGKGGIGKSFLAYNLISYLRNLSNDVNKIGVIDTDTNNGIISTIENFNPINLGDCSLDDWATNGLLKLISYISDKNISKHYVVDIGSNTFPIINNYMIINKCLPELLLKSSCKINLHLLIAANDRSEAAYTISLVYDTLDYIIELKTILNDYPNEKEEVLGKLNIFLWLNEIHGSVYFNGEPFESNKNFLDKYNKHIDYLIHIPKLSIYEANDFGILRSKGKTFEEADTIFSGFLGKMQLLRVNNVKKKIFHIMDNSLSTYFKEVDPDTFSK